MTVYDLDRERTEAYNKGYQDGVDDRPRKLSGPQEQHLADIKSAFVRNVDRKYRQGAAEHGGDLQGMVSADLLTNAIDECLDLFVYLTTLKAKL